MLTFYPPDVIASYPGIDGLWIDVSNPSLTICGLEDGFGSPNCDSFVFWGDGTPTDSSIFPLLPNGIQGMYFNSIVLSQARLKTAQPVYVDDVLEATDLFPTLCQVTCD